MVDHSLLESVKDTKIEITTLSDHSPVTMKVRIPGPHRQPFSWRLNESLLNNVKVAERVQEEIDLYLAVNDTADISGTILWKALKAYIRGVLISIGAGRKKERLKRKENLISEIHRLEQAHESHKGYHQEILHHLITKREELKDLMETDSSRIFNKQLKDRYQWGNKVGKHLAGTLKKKRDINFIDKIHNKNRDLMYTTKETGEEFRKYYSALYSVRQKGSGTPGKDEMSEDFLKLAELSTLSENDKMEMDRPITEEEIYSALKTSPPVKSPGPDGFTSHFYKKFKESLVPKLCQV